MRTIGRWSVASVISFVLGFARFAAVIAFVVTVCLTAALPFVSNPNLTVTVPVSFSIETPPEIRVGRNRFDFEIVRDRQQAKRDAKRGLDSVEGSLAIPTASRTVIAANAAALLVILAFVIFVLGQLRAVLRTLIHANPFVPANATRIRSLGLAVIAGEFMGSAIVFAENYYAKTHVVVPGLTFDAWPQLSLMTIGYGLIILVIAEVFRAGTRLDEEQSLTI